MARSRTWRAATFTTSGAVRASSCQRLTAAPSLQNPFMTASQSSSRRSCSALPSNITDDPNVRRVAQATFSRSLTSSPTCERPSGVGTATDR